MKTAIGVGLALALVAGGAGAQGPAPAQPPPQVAPTMPAPPPVVEERPTGVPLIVTGSIFTAGALTFGAVSIYCGIGPASPSPANPLGLRQPDKTCAISMGIGSGLLLLAGVPLLVKGGIERRLWLEWSRTVTIAPTPTGASVVGSWMF